MNNMKTKIEDQEEIINQLNILSSKLLDEKVHAENEVVTIQQEKNQLENDIIALKAKLYDFMTIERKC